MDRRTDGQTEISSLDRVCIPRSALKSRVTVYYVQRIVSTLKHCLHLLMSIVSQAWHCYIILSFIHVTGYLVEF